MEQPTNNKTFDFATGLKWILGVITVTFSLSLLFSFGSEFIGSIKQPAGACKMEDAQAAYTKAIALIEGREKALDWWLTGLGIIITLAAVFFVYEAWGIRKVLNDLQKDSDEVIKRLENHAELEKSNLNKIYTHEKNELQKKQTELEELIKERTIYVQLQALIFSKEFSAAKAGLQKQIKKNIASNQHKSDCLFSLGRIYSNPEYKEGFDINKAIDCYLEAWEKHKTSAIGFNLALCYNVIKKTEESLRWLKSAKKLDPEDEDIALLERSFKKKSEKKSS